MGGGAGVGEGREVGGGREHTDPPAPPPPSWALWVSSQGPPLWDRTPHWKVHSPRSQGAGFVIFYSSCLTFPYLVIKHERVLSIHNGEPCPFAFVQGPVHLWMATGMKKLTHSLLRLAIPGDIARLMAFFLYFLVPPPPQLCVI